MSFEKEIAKIEKDYQAGEGTDKAAVVEAFSQLHKKTKDAAAQVDFALGVAPACGGIYIPHVFWSVLALFWEDEQYRSSLHKLIRTFAESDFEEEEKALMKPLLVVYFVREREFEVSRARTLALADAHPSVKEWFDQLVQFPKNNKVAAKTFVEKFALLRKTHPNFDLFKLPIGKLEEILAGA